MLGFLIEKIMPFFQLDRRIYVGASSLMALRGLQMAMSFATMYVLTRSLSKNDFGEYQFVLSVAGTMTIFCLTGLGDSVMQAQARGDTKAYTKARTLSFLAAWAGSAIMVVMALWFAAQGEENIAVGLVLAALLAPFANGLTLWKNILAGTQKFPRLARLEGVNSIVLTALMVAVCLIWPGNFYLPVLLVMAIPAAQNIYQTLAHKTPPPGEPIARMLHDPYVAYGLKLSLYGVIGTVGMYLDRILLFFFLSPEVLAVYVVAEKITSLCATAVKDVAAILAPRFAVQKHYTARLNAAFTVFAVLFGLAIVFLAVVIVPIVIPLLFGSKYEDSILYTQVLVGSVAIGNIAVLKMRFIQSRLDDRAMRHISIWMNVLRVGASLALVPFFGIWGAIGSAYIFRTGTAILTDRQIRNHQPP
ncbi:MAG: oligosaccharide flippase family protein [Rhodospirillales bacterium]|nr:oligosaccharide flippase family protein [Rhodospirillales bacterium]